MLLLYYYISRRTGGNRGKYIRKIIMHKIQINTTDFFICSRFLSTACCWFLRVDDNKMNGCKKSIFNT